MSEIKSFPNNQSTYVGAEWVMRWLHGRTSGVFAADNNAAVTAAPGQMAVLVSDGIGWLSNSEGNGIVWWNDAMADTGSSLQLDIDTADSSFGRIDRIIVEWETTNYVALPEIKVLKGSLSYTPVPPALTNNSVKRQISLARVSVPAGTVSLSASLISDERLDESVCGLVTESIAIDTTVIRAQMEALLATIEEELEEINNSSGTVVSVNGKAGIVNLDADDVGAVSTEDVEYKMYDSVTDLGLTAGSATIAGAYAAMPDSSVLICDAGEFTGAPNAEGTVEIAKLGTSRGFINFYGKTAGIGDYRMNLNASSIPDGVWNALPTGIVDLKSRITTTGNLNSNDVYLYRYGKMAFFKFRMQPKTNFPVAFTKTHTLPVHPSSTTNFQVVVPKTNASSAILVEVRNDGGVYVYSYGSAYSDWVTGELWFPIQD